VLDPAPAVCGQTKIVSTTGRATKNASPAARQRRVTSLRPMSAASTTHHMTAEYHGIDSNRNTVAASLRAVPTRPAAA
jgi:hypothetical protein